RQFAQLSRHLLAAAPVPAFMDSALLTHDACGSWRWFEHLGAGESIRTAPGLPIPLTVEMAAGVLGAPSDLTALQAVRWGQVLGLGGDGRLARELTGSELGARFDGPEREAEWASLITWLTAYPLSDRMRVGPIVAYVSEHP